MDNDGIIIDKSRKKITDACRGGAHHAILIEGEKGSGRYTAALLAACETVGMHKDLIMRGIYPDVCTVTGEKGLIPVNEVRRIKADAAILPNEADKKVYIIRDAQELNDSGQNALLKILEEPPEHVCFILTVDNREKLLATVLSRMMIFSLENLTPAQCAEVLRKKYGDREGIDELSEIFGGNIGKAEEALSEGGADEVAELCDEVINYAVEGKNWKAMEKLAIFEKDKEKFLKFLELLKMRGAKKVTEAALSGKNAEKYMKICSAAEFCAGHIQKNGNYQLAMAGFLSDLRGQK